jgi:hypothetical protein
MSDYKVKPVTTECKANTQTTVIEAVPGSPVSDSTTAATSVNQQQRQDTRFDTRFNTVSGGAKKLINFKIYFLNKEYYIKSVDEFSALNAFLNVKRYKKENILKMYNPNTKEIHSYIIKKNTLFKKMI